jgi:predicted DNA-binding transcriptional regulator AlpA
MLRLTTAAYPAPNGAVPDAAEQFPLLYDTADLCRVLRISMATLHRLKSAGKLPRAKKLGAQLRWDVSEICEWVAAGMPDLERWETLKNAHGRR